MDNEFAIEVSNVSKVYPLRQAKIDEQGNRSHEHHALKDVSFEIKKGESVGIIGPNGSGKSTLLKILAGITKPTSGKVQVRGKVASILDIGAGFHPELSGRENVYLNGQIHGFSKKEIESKFDEIVTFSGIEKFIDEPVKNYSNGMYLRLAFSIMAHLDFDVYLFDEVLSVGDAEFRRKVGFRIRELLGEKDKSMVIVSHNSKELVNLCSSYYSVIDNTMHFEYALPQEHIESYFKKIQGDLLQSGVFSIKKIWFKNTQGIYCGLYDYDENIYFGIDIQSKKPEGEFPYLFEIVDSLDNSIIVTSYLLQKDTLQMAQGEMSMVVTLPSHFFNVGRFYLNVYQVSSGRVTLLSERVITFSIQMKEQINLYWTNKIPTGILLPLKWEIL